MLALVAVILFFILRPSGNSPDHPKDPSELNRAESNFIYTKHAKCRMECRHIDASEVAEIYRTGKINYKKSEIENSRSPKYAIEGTTHDRQHVRIIYAPAKNGVVVVTVIDLEQEWQCACS